MLLSEGFFFSMALWAHKQKYFSIHSSAIVNTFKTRALFIYYTLHISSWCHQYSERSVRNNRHNHLLPVLFLTRRCFKKFLLSFWFIFFSLWFHNNKSQKLELIGCNNKKTTVFSQNILRVVMPVVSVLVERERVFFCVCTTTKTNIQCLLIPCREFFYIRVRLCGGMLNVPSSNFVSTNVENILSQTFIWVYFFFSLQVNS